MNDAQLALFWHRPVPAGQASADALAVVELPEWMNGTETPEQRRHALAGRHPTGRALGPSLRRCAGCVHRIGHQPRGASKCQIDESIWETNQRGTDIRGRWRACDAWETKR